jgi:molybdate transport system substrate-binding protein
VYPVSVYPVDRLRTPHDNALPASLREREAADKIDASEDMPRFHRNGRTGKTVMSVRLHVRVLAALCLTLCVAGITADALAADLKVLSGGAVKAAVTDLAEAWSKETGHRVNITYATTGASLQKLAAGEPADVVILTTEAIGQLSTKGTVIAGTKADVARVGIGVAVREGAPKPDISTAEALKQMMLAAKSVAYMDPSKGGTSGIHFTKVLEEMGIASAVKSKAVLVDTGFAAERVAKGEAEIVVHQISEILPVKGVSLIGPLPREIQKVTVYSAVVAAKSQAQEAAKAFIASMMTPAARAKFAAVGLDYRE